MTVSRLVDALVAVGLGDLRPGPGRLPLAGMNVQILQDYVIAGDAAKAIGPITRWELRTGRAGTYGSAVQASGLVSWVNVHRC